MARTKFSLNKGQPSPDYPQGTHTVTFTDLEEDDWWLITNMFKGRIEYLSQRLHEIKHMNDPDVIHNTAHWYEETIERLVVRLQEFEDQISPVYFKRKRAEHAARNKQPNK
jgi:hypothetical protein